MTKRKIRAKQLTLEDALEHAAEQTMRMRDDLGRDCAYVHSVLDKALLKLRQAQYAAKDSTYNDALDNEIYQYDRLRQWTGGPEDLPLHLQAEQYAIAFRERCRIEHIRLKLGLSVATNPNELPNEE